MRMAWLKGNINRGGEKWQEKCCGFLPTREWSSSLLDCEVPDAVFGGTQVKVE
jgi:hypothetical protein